VTARIPFGERGGALRGCLDLVSGRFPRFVFGGSVGDDVLPIFHFHDVSRDDLEPKLRYLAANGYRAVTSDDIAAFVAARGPARRQLVGLCFDDAWASLWSVAAPLLKRYGLTAIAYAIPARIDDADGCRPQGVDGPAPAKGSPFVTWPELRTLHASGVVDVQCHTYSHSKVFCAPEVDGFVAPGYASTPLLNRPQIAPPPQLRFVTPNDLGAPLHPARSRMSDGRRAVVGLEAHRRCVELVAREGGERFFDRPDWRSSLEDVCRTTAEARVESADEQRAAIQNELDRGRAILNDRLRTNTVRHICLPWGVSGDQTAEALKRLGYRTAFANRLRGVHAVRRGDDPFWLKRLPNKYIFRLPGRGRRVWA
jgi:peptidoglycan/xylan/chitin deacetylase (PgdA/CDA1 family)